MGRLREKILPSLRAALEKLEENAETIPHEDSPHYLPRWDFSQSQARYLSRNIPEVHRNSINFDRKWVGSDRKLACSTGSG